MTAAAQGDQQRLPVTCSAAAGRSSPRAARSATDDVVAWSDADSTRLPARPSRTVTDRHRCRAHRVLRRPGRVWELAYLADLKASYVPPRRPRWRRNSGVRRGRASAEAVWTSVSRGRWARPCRWSRRLLGLAMWSRWPGPPSDRSSAGCRACRRSHGCPQRSSGSGCPTPRSAAMVAAPRGAVDRQRAARRHEQGAAASTGSGGCSACPRRGVSGTCCSGRAARLPGGLPPGLAFAWRSLMARS